MYRDAFSEGSVPTRRHFLRSAVISGTALAGAPLLPAAAAGTGAYRAQVSDNPVARQGGRELDMCISRWGGALELPDSEFQRVTRALTERCINELGGMKRFVSRGDRVWITPNIGFRYGPKFAVNTHPDVVGTLVRLCFDAGAKEVKVGCNAAQGARVTYPRSGIQQAVEAEGGTMVVFDPDNFVDVPINGERLALWPLYRDIEEADAVINAPVAKHHSLSLVTSCMKNHMGMAGDPRYTWHTDLPTCLTDYSAYLRRELTVVDAMRVLMAGGPQGGELRHVRNVGMVAAGKNVVGLEAFSAERLGLDPHKGRTMAKGEARGLGHVDYRNKACLREVELTA